MQSYVKLCKVMHTDKGELILKHIPLSTVYFHCEAGGRKIMNRFSHYVNCFLHMIMLEKRQTCSDFRRVWACCCLSWNTNKNNHTDYNITFHILWKGEGGKGRGRKGRRGKGRGGRGEGEGEREKGRKLVVHVAVCVNLRGLCLRVYSKQLSLSNPNPGSRGVWFQ